MRSCSGWAGMPRGAIAVLALAAIALLLMLTVPVCPPATASAAPTNPAVAAEHHAQACSSADESVAHRSPIQQPLIQHATNGVRPADDRSRVPRPTGAGERREAVPPRGQTLLLLLSVQRN